MDFGIYSNYMKNIRQMLHQTPELCYDEFLTQSLLVDQIKSLGYPYRTIKTGIVSDLFVGAKKTVALRCDMDGLKLEEQNDIPYKSKNKSIMHACGHDGHMALMLGLMNYLNQYPPKVNVRFIFQPAEEGQGGAAVMIDSGAIEGVDEIYAIHVDPTLPKGKVGLCFGVSMAGAVEFDIDTLGKSAHVSQADMGIDALTSAVSVASECLSITKEVNNKNRLLHIGAISCGTGRNIVAENANLKLTLRYFDRKDIAETLETLDGILRKNDLEYGTQSKINIISEYIPVKNNNDCVKRVIDICGENVVMHKPKFAAEDFAYYLDNIKGCMIWLGVNSGENVCLHSSNFNFDESCLDYGLEIFSKLIME